MQEFVKYTRPDGTVEFRNPEYETLVAAPVVVAEPLVIPQSEIAAYEASKYKQARANEYPSIGDQLDALFKAGVFPAEMSEQIQAVKDKYPKTTQS